MTFYQATADASDQYRATSSCAIGDQKFTATPGNLADIMKNAVIEVSDNDELTLDGDEHSPK